MHLLGVLLGVLLVAGGAWGVLLGGWRRHARTKTYTLLVIAYLHERHLIPCPLAAAHGRRFMLSARWCMGSLHKGKSSGGQTDAPRLEAAALGCSPPART